MTTVLLHIQPDKPDQVHVKVTLVVSSLRYPFNEDDGHQLYPTDLVRAQFDQGLFLWENNVAADVQFTFPNSRSQEIVQANKDILQRRSPYFKLSESNDGPPVPMG